MKLNYKESQTMSHVHVIVTLITTIRQVCSMPQFSLTTSKNKNLTNINKNNKNTDHIL